MSASEPVVTPSRSQPEPSPADPAKPLAGRVALITGAGQGVGRGIALALADAGASLSISGRTLSKVEATAALVEERGGRVVASECDVADPDQVIRNVADTVEALGGLHILVNNAAWAPMGNLLDVTDKAFDLGFRTGPLATLRFMRAAHPHLKGGGVIVNLGSGSALRPDPVGLGAYAAVKDAISVLTRAAAVEWGPDGIRANTVLPFAQSPGMDWYEEHVPDQYEQVLAEVPLGRVGDCELDIGRAVVFMCSPASSYMTGSSLMVDGGQTYLR